MYRPTIQGYSIKFQRLGLFLVVEGLKIHQHVVIFSQGSIFLKTNVEDTVQYLKQWNHYCTGSTSWGIVKQWDIHLL